MLEVLLGDQQIDIQDENLQTCVPLLELRLCVTMGDNKAAMSSLPRGEITIPCLRKTFHFQLMIQIQSNLAQLTLFALLVDLQRITESDSSWVDSAIIRQCLKLSHRSCCDGG